MSREDFAARLTSYYASTPLPKIDVNDLGLSQILLALFKTLSPSSSARTAHHSEAGIHFTTFFLDEVPSFNLVSVSTDDHPIESWWDSCIANKAPHRHRPEANQFLSLGKDWTFADELWASVFEKCRDLGVGWWALTTTSWNRCLLGVLARDWKTLVSAPAANTRDDMFRGIVYWADCAIHSESPTSTHLKRPDNPQPTSDHNPIPPSRIARLLDQASRPSSPFNRLTRSRTVARRAFVAYDEKTGEPNVVPLGSSHVEEMRMKSAWMRTGDELDVNQAVNDASNAEEIVYSVTGEERYNDPDMAMDVEPIPGFSIVSIFAQHPFNVQPQNSGFNGGSALRPRDEQMGPAPRAADEEYDNYRRRVEHTRRWHQEHFSSEDDLDRSYTTTN
ncbi:hypothetical protein FS837_000206 [Tulasnella sp. UAMH 9824]|nr:hypothetical protein FS837_000206 [Tulasnella sp. UAMH 9824]